MRKSALALLVALVVSSPAHAFTQSGFGTAIGDGVPMGHEWLTRRAAIELLLGQDPIMKPDPNDPRLKWQDTRKGLAKNLDLKGAEGEVARIKTLVFEKEDRYMSTYHPVFDTILGERWVDIGGFDLLTSNLPGNYNCWDTVAQEPPEIQYDHHMRRYDDAGDKGGVDAAKASQERFKQYFIAAAMAPSYPMLVWDGGAFKPALTKVDRNYFLFGRALHLFQDSFSREHTVRIEDDRLEQVRQVKSYLCAYGSEQHTHSKEAVEDYTSGDVIWTTASKHSSGWASYKPSNMTMNGLVAMEATKDLWAAFIRTMAVKDLALRKAKAEGEAQTLIRNWLGFNGTEMLAWYAKDSNRNCADSDKCTYVRNPEDKEGSGQTQAECMMKLGVESGRQSDEVERLRKEQRVCLINMVPADGYADLFDPQIHVFFNWGWFDEYHWKPDDPNWNIPNYPADRGRIRTIRSVRYNDSKMTTTAIKADALVHVNTTDPPVAFVLVSDDDKDQNSNVFFRSLVNPHLFLSYAADSAGRVKLWEGTKDSSYDIHTTSDGRNSIMSRAWKDQYIWVDQNRRVHLNSDGDSAHANAQWTFEGLQEIEKK